MTHAGQFLRIYCERHPGGQRKFAAQAGLTEGHLSKILSGARRGIREATLAGVLGALPEDRRVPFLAAYVRDLIPEEYGEFFTGETSPTRVREKASNYQIEDGLSGLVIALKESFRSPKRNKVAQTMQRLVKNAAASPEFLRGLEQFAQLKIA